MKKHYYVALMKVDNSILLIIKDNCLLWALSKVSRLAEFLVDKSFSMKTEIPKGNVNKSWKKIGFIKLSDKINGKEESIDLYLTRSKNPVLPPLVTKKGFVVLDPIYKAKVIIGERDALDSELIGKTKFYKCDVRLELVRASVKWLTSE